MRHVAFRIGLATFALAVTAFALSALSSTSAEAGRKPPKPCPTCAPTLTLPDGRVCTLEACGFDCVYSCPL